MNEMLSRPAVDIQERLEAQGVRYALASYADIHGRSKCKVVPIDHLDQMLNGSELFTGAALDGVPQEVNDDEVAAIPDPASATVLPWKNDTAWFASDLWLNGQPFEACSRNILKRAIRKATEMGFVFNLGIETEFFLFRETEGGGFSPLGLADPLDKPAYDVRTMLACLPVVQEIVEAMNGLGWDVFSFDQEDAPGQFETDFKYADALTMADRFTFFRLMAHEIARKHGLFASFMPKPYGHRTGSGAHYNMSLADIRSGDQCVRRQGGPARLRTVGDGLPVHRRGAAPRQGHLRRHRSHREQLQASGCARQHVRLHLGADFRLLRQQQPHELDPYSDERAAHRMPRGGHFLQSVSGRGHDADGGPGRDSRKLDPGDPHRENMYLHTPETLKSMGIEHLPRTLGEAVDAFEADPLSAQVMGPMMFDAYVKFKRAEWVEYTRTSPTGRSPGP